MNLTAILAAAGRGSRLGRPKQLLDFDGKPLAAWPLETLARSPLVSAIIIACDESELEAFKAIAQTFGHGKVGRVTPGGARRQDSVFAALALVSPACDYVLVHDGARPFLTEALIERCVTAAGESGAAITAVPVKDTIKRTSDGSVVATTIPRDQLWAAQTPQVFAHDILLQAHQRANGDGFLGTDDAMLVEWAGLAPVAIVEGSYDNIKITTEEDLALAERIAARQRST